jgi:hypothetical protein
MSRKISGKELAQDIRSGMHENQLMVKYEISVSQLREIRTKLEDKGLVPKAARADDRPHTSQQGSAATPCPGCGYSMDPSFDECPRCGLIVSRVHGSTSGMPAASPARSYSPLPVMETSNSHKSRTQLIIWSLVASVAAIVVVASFMTQRKNRSAVLSSAKPTLQLVAASDPLQIRWQEVVGELADLKQRSQGLLSGWTKDMDQLLIMATEMIKASERARQTMESMKRQEYDQATQVQGGPTGPDLGNPMEQQYRKARDQATAATEKLAQIPKGGKMPLGPTDQERFIALGGQIRIVSSRILETN